MQGHHDRLQFAPPPPPGMLRALGFAVFAHLLLMLALTWGISWNREPITLSAEAELWSRVPQEAAPRANEPAPAPPVPVPVPEPKPAPPPPPVEAVKPPAPPEPAPREVDIALEREKEKKAEQRRKQLALEREKEREKKREEQRELAAQKKLEAAKEREAERKLEARKKLELAKARAAEEKKQEAANKLKLAEEARRIEAQRQANLERMKGMAGATGAPSATGTAQRSSGPSDSYAGRIRARVKPNIVFSEDIAGNPSAEVEVRTSPDGTIVGQRITKSSGVRGWDEAVLKAVIKTEVLPRDVDGRVHSPLTIIFRPKD